jgi:poly-gamma-glutamate synthesis protein (capsule biosynthesis protein)
VLVFAYGFPSSGIPGQWAAAADQPGVNLLPSVSVDAADKIIKTIGKYKNADDVVVVSLHWGGNWGYDISPTHIEFAHALADSRLVNVIHGHSSHHPIGIEVYRGVPILFGCGDLINDYEGIGGYEAYRANLVLMYWLRLQRTSGAFCGLSMTPFKLEKFRLNNVTAADADWLSRTLTRASREFGTQVVRDHGVELRVVSGEAAEPTA